MRNISIIMAALLCVLLALPVAIAEETAYVPGAPTASAFGEAFSSGKLVSGTLELNLDLDAQMLGLTAEDEPMLADLLQAVSQAKLTLGTGLITDGLRIALGGELTDAAGEKPVGVSALADVTLDGIAVESDLIPGKRVNVRWETLLALCGMSQADIEMLMSIKELDPEAVLAAIEAALAELEPVLEMAVQLAAPYAETVVGFVLSLPMEVQENLSEEGYPPTATELCVTVTEKDLGALITLLCDQFEQDNTLMVFANMLLQEADAGVTAAEIIAEIRAAAAEMTNTDTPLYLYLGMSEDGTPLYSEAYIVNEPTGESIYGGLFLYQDMDGVWQFELLGGYYDAQDNPIAALGMNISYVSDPADANVYAALFEMYAVEGENPLMEIVMTMDNTKAESELPAYDTNVAMSMYVADGEMDVQMVSSAAGRQGLTAAGGEYSNATATTDVYVGDMVQTQTEIVEQMIEPTADGGIDGYVKVSETLPASGIKQLDLTITYAASDIDPAASSALEQLSLESITNDDMNALVNQVMTILTEEKLPGLIANLPASIVEMIADMNVQ